VLYNERFAGMRSTLIVVFLGCVAGLIMWWYTVYAKKATQPVFCCVAGKSGGHIIPGVTLMYKYAKEQTGQVLFFSTDSDLDQNILQQYTFIKYYVPLSCSPLESRSFFSLCKFAVQCSICFVKSLYYFMKLRPKKIITTGGYIALPVCYAGWILGIPYELFELNAVPGKATLFLSKRASKIYCCFPQAVPFFKSAYGIQVCLHEYPVRFTKQDKISKEMAREHLGINTTKKVLLVLGGSQGSEFINSLVMCQAAKSLRIRDNWFIVHQTGASKVAAVRDFYVTHTITARVFDYTTAMALYYAAADFVVTRAGAGTLFELLFFQRPALIIPLETETTDHQKSNAYAFAQVYGQLYTVIEQNQLERNPDVLTSKLK
jgi:UDP-N-acetylglucosamine--N-acetylmuramyl-(pentapeptide) pyrophosphoryl-undecaprenol N-acetylglucosamine transferase